MAKKRVVIYLSDNVITQVEDKINKIRNDYAVETTISQVIAGDVEELYGSKIKVE